MHRRQLLAAVGAVGGLGAGCLSAPVAEDGRPGPAAPESLPAPVAPTAALAEVDLPVPRTALARGAERDAIPAVLEPAFAPDWRGIDADLGDDDLVVGVERGGAARAYPLEVMRTHEVVNDDLEGPLLVTYCPLCATAVVAVRTVGETAPTFGVSGLLYRFDLVLYDGRTDSLWSQILAQAIRGPATGQRLEIVPSTLTTWDAWRRSAPEGEVLLPPPASGTVSPPRDDGVGVGYEDRGAVGVGGPREALGDDRLPPTAPVVGVATADAARAYPVGAVREAGVVNDWVGGLPVVVAADPTPHAYVRAVDGRVPTFEPAGEGRVAAAGSEWVVPTGRAVTGPHEGDRLRSASRVSPLYWFAWATFRPDTAVYG